MLNHTTKKLYQKVKRVLFFQLEHVYAYKGKILFTVNVADEILDYEH